MKLRILSYCYNIKGRGLDIHKKTYKTLNIDRVIKWTEIEIRNSEQGQPYVVLHGKVKKIAKEKNISSILVSISHIKTRAVASAVALIS